MAVKCILTGQEKVNLSGDTMTGDLKVGSSSIGTNGYIEGTWLKTTAAGDKAGDFATIDNSGWIYKRAPANVLGDIGGQAKITANGILKGDGTGTITAAQTADFPKEVFWATYGETTAEEIDAAFNNNKIIKVFHASHIYDLTRQGVNTYDFSCITNAPGNYLTLSLSRNDNVWRFNEGIPGSILDHTTNLSLPAASWTGSDPYTQTLPTTQIAINNFTKVDIQPSEELYDQLLTDNVGYLAFKSVNDTLIAVAKGGKPSVDLTVQVTYNQIHKVD